MGCVNPELYNSSYCRLCCVDCGQNGLFMYSENEGNISSNINKYLPVKVSDDGVFPRAICSNCHVKLLTTISFFSLLEEGQKKLQRLAYQASQETSQGGPSSSRNEELVHIGYGKVLNQKRRGRPRKVSSFVNRGPPPDPLPDPPSADPNFSLLPAPQDSDEDETRARKRKRKLPSRFRSTLQGKDLDKAIKEVFKENGLPDEEEDDPKPPVEYTESDVIGKVASAEGEDLGEVILPSGQEKSVLIYRCEVCNMIFSQGPKFFEHQATHHKESNETQESDKKKQISNSRKDQVGAHSEGSEPYTCNICSKKFKYVSSLSYHKESEHNDKRKFVCNKCPRVFKHRQLLRRHQLVHSSLRYYTCEECGASFKTKGNLSTHMLVHTGEKKFVCEVCGQFFVHRTSLNLHMRLHKGEKPFKCGVCQKSFTQKGNLLEHQRIHTGEKPFKCSYCGRAFTTSSQCRIHMKRHTGERPWYCDICHKSFLNKSTWRCHLRRHAGEKPFNCFFCGRTFSEHWALKKHVRTHTGEKPYVCPTCGKAFSDCSNLTKHRKCHEKEDGGTEEVDFENMEQIVYFSYADPVDPNSTTEVSDKIVADNPEKTDTQPLNEEFLFQVVDEMGNPMKYTLPDGSQLEVTSDGVSMVVKTDDGQTIPVSLTDTSGKAVTPILTPVVFPSLENADTLVDISSIELVSNEEGNALSIPKDFFQIV